MSEFIMFYLFFAWQVTVTSFVNCAIRYLIKQVIKVESIASLISGPCQLEDTKFGHQLIITITKVQMNE